MTSPLDQSQTALPTAKPSPFNSITPADEADALSSITRMLTGSKMLANEPGVLYSLAAQNAHPADAHAIDQFMQALDAEKAVNIARASNQPLKLTSDQETLLKVNGVQYQDVMWTPQKAADMAKQQALKLSGGKETVKTNSDGSLALDKNGQIQTQAVADAGSSDFMTALKGGKIHGAAGGDNSGVLGSIGGFLDHVGHDAKNWAGDAVTGLGKGFNAVSTSVARDFEGAAGSAQQMGSQGLDPSLRGAATDAVKVQDTDAQAMRALGYDPQSVWSILGYYSSGKAQYSLGNLNDKYGTDKVDEALKYLNDPKGYVKSIAADPASYVKTTDGQTVPTPEAAAKLAYLNSKEFTTLAREVNANQANIGTAFAKSVGIDPLAHPEAYNLTSAGMNVVASFAVDPVLAAANTVKIAKLSQIGIDTLADGQGAAKVLTNSGMWAKSVQRGWQRAIDLADQIRNANAAGDTAQSAALTARFNAELPGLSQIQNEFIGEHALTGELRNPTAAELAENPNAAAVPLFGKTGGIRNLDDAAQFVESKYGLLRLMNGRAINESSLMPGALSAFGVRKLKGLTADWMTSRSATRAEKAYDTVLSRVEANPALAKPLIDDGLLMKLPPTMDDAINSLDGTVIADRYALTDAGKGQVAYNLRRTGDALGDSTLGRFSLTAMAARGRMAAQRYTTMLPRNTIIDLNDPRASDTIYKYAMTYLNRGDANSLRAAFNSADFGQRKTIVSGLIDQIGHAAGLGHSASGRNLLARIKTEQEAYANSGAEIELNGQRVGLTEAQTRTQWLMPSFQMLQKASAKFGLWDSTMSRALNSDAVDSLMTQWKMGALFKPSTVTRNQLEGWLRTMLDGHAGAAIQARAFLTARHKELWDRGYGLEDKELYVAARGRADTLTSELKVKDLKAPVRATKQRQLAEMQRQMATVENKPIVQHLLATEKGDTALAKQIEKGSMLHGDVLGRGKTMTKLADSAPLAIVGRAWRHMMLKPMDEETLQALLTIGPQELSEFMEGYGQQILAHDLGFAYAANETTLNAKAGYGTSSMRGAVQRARARGANAEDPNVRKVWTNQALDGTVGADRYENALSRLVNSQPETSKAVLEYIDNPTLGLEHIVKQLDKEAVHTAYGSVYFDNIYEAPNVARDAVSPAEVAAGKRDWADKLASEFTYMLTSRNGKYSTKIAKYINEHGKAPSGDWVAHNLKGNDLPHTALAEQTMALPAGDLIKNKDGWVQSFQDLEGAAYQHFVEKALQRTTSSPVFMAHYAEARKGLNPVVERMVEQSGVSREAAENLAKELAVKRAWVKTEQLIDDPGQKTQFDVIARNMFPFARATQAMIRRWGAGLWANPAAARKMMLAYEGAVHSGMIYTNSYGEPTFTYPGSGAMQLALRALDEVPGFRGASQFPVASDMTGGVLMSVPGADNPLRMSMGPMISIPLREAYKHLLPAAWQGDALKLDEFVNGPVGAGETFNQFVPTAIRKFYENLSADDRNSALVSSMNGAIANLAAAGLVPAPDAPPTVKQAFRSRLQQQVHNQLFLRFVFGLFAPAAPSQPTEATAASGHADFAFSEAGIRNLSDEYKAILNDTGGNVAQANAVFTAMHPDNVVYAQLNNGKGITDLPGSGIETARSGLASTDAYLPPTMRTFEWMATHEQFIKDYPRLAVYFLPQTGAKEPFEDAAYKAQIELGLRQKKTPEEFMTDVYVKHAESLFYPAVQKWDGMIANAKLSNDYALANDLTNRKSAWEKEFKLLNPAFGNKIDNYGNSRGTAEGQLSDIRQMLKTNAVPEGQAGLLGQMVEAWDGYQKFITDHPGSDAVTKQQRSMALNMFNQWAAKNVANGPLADLFNGVFRTLNTNLDKQPTGG